MIQITDSLILTVPQEAAKATLSVMVDGKYVGGRGAAKLRKQKDEEGNLLNVTYIWGGVTVRMTNVDAGNHRVSVVLRASGNGVSESVTAWSGTVYVGTGTTTVVLKGGWGNKLTRIQ